MSDSEDSIVTYTSAPSSLDYVPGPKEPEQAPLSPEFVPEPVYLKFMPLEDEVFPAEEQPLPAVVSPTADSPGYIADSDPEEDEEDPKEEPKEDPEEDPIDYPAGRGDDDDDNDESSDDDEDEDDDDDVEEEEEDEEDKEEHPAPADSVPPPVHRVTARMSVRAQIPISLPSDTEVARFLAILTPPPSSISPWSSPLPCYHLHHHHFPHWISSLLPIPLPTPSPPLLLPSTDHRADVHEVCLPPRKRLCFALEPRYEVGESSSTPTARPTRGFRTDYGFVATLDDEIRRDPERDDTDEIYVRLDHAHDARSLMSGQLNMLYRDRRTHACSGSTAVRDRGVAGSRPQVTDTVYRGPEIAKDTTDTVDSTSESTGTR
ncbi:hypothetical protein Tco_1398284 [Tanacetum coccineum]